MQSAFVRPEPAVKQFNLAVGAGIALKHREISRVRLDRHDPGLGMKVPEAQRLDTDVRAGIDNHADRIYRGVSDSVAGSEKVRHHALVRPSAEDDSAAKPAN